MRENIRGFGEGSGLGSELEIDRWVRVKRMGLYKVYCSFRWGEGWLVVLYIIIWIGRDKRKCWLEGE